MRVAIVHDYLNQAGGAERVVAMLHVMFPEAPIFTTIVDPETLWPALRDADIRPSWMQRLPGIPRHFRAYLPLYGKAIESFDLSEYDLVISSSSAFAKAAITRPDAVHICYCHTPMRFGWDYSRYVERAGYKALTRALLTLVIQRVRAWDLRTAVRPDLYVANSAVTAQRILRLYGRTSEIVFPPVDVSQYAPEPAHEGFYLVVSRLNPYKRVDLAIRALNGSGRPLVIVGDGPARHVLELLADRNVRFLGRVPDSDVARAYARCRALILPGEEDFGITPLEANASGRPVVAFKGGGAVHTVVDGQTGVFFADQTPEALRDAIARCERTSWNTQTLRAHAEAFSPDVFVGRFRRLVDRMITGYARSRPSTPTREPFGMLAQPRRG